MARFDADGVASILVVDDEIFMRRLIRQALLQVDNFMVHEASDAGKAWELLDKIAPEIDCILLDLNMPGMSGLEMLKAIRQSPDSPDKEMPIIVLTGSDDIDSIQSAKEFGVNGYLLKPVTAAHLKKCLDRVFKATSRRA